MERLDKLVALFGNMTRREATALIRAGQVRIDGVPCRNPAQKVEERACALSTGGRTLDCRPHRYVMLNKPQGTLCVSRDPRAETVTDLLPPALRRRGMAPAGRLDRDTVGLVVLTDDGEWAHRLISPKKGVFKQYRAIVDGRIGAREIDAFAKGLALADGTRCLPAALRALNLASFAEKEYGRELSDDEETQFLHTFSANYRISLPPTVSFLEIAIQEGKYHQIKRMCAATGHNILWLKRFAIGGLALDATLSEGECREMDAAEVASVFEKVEAICAK